MQLDDAPDERQADPEALHRASTASALKEHLEDARQLFARHADAAIGDDGITMSSLPDSPLHQVFVEMMGYERGTLAFIDDPVNMGALCDHIMAKNEEHYALAMASPAEVMLTGERIWNLGRLLNLREGVEPDGLPRRLYDPGFAHTEGPSAGKAIGEQAFKDGLQEYYRLRGWDESGIPTEAKLAEVGVDVRL